MTMIEVQRLAKDTATRNYLLVLMGEHHGNVTHAAKEAGVKRESFHRLLRRYNIDARIFRTQKST